MKRDADLALRAYYEALAADPIPAIEVRLGRRVSGPILPLAAGVCAAAILPLLTPGQEADVNAVTGVASLKEDAPMPQSFLEQENQSWLV